MAPQQQTWARLRSDYGCPLRRGAWYRVLSVSPLEAVVDVDKKPVLLPREYVEIVASRPSRWTVVREVEPSPRVMLSPKARYWLGLLRPMGRRSGTPICAPSPSGTWTVTGAPGT